jgi:hypothetical protein
MKEKLKAYYEYVVLPVSIGLVYFLLAYACFSLVFSQIAQAYESVAYYSHEFESGTSTKTCVYERYGEYYYMTVSTIRICPMSIRVEV